MINSQQSSAKPDENDLCWYCKKNPADKRFAASIPMYNVTGGDYKNYGTVRVKKINFQRIGVAVPRCESCQRRQHVIDVVTRVITVIFFLVGLIFVGAATGYAFHIIPYPYDPLNMAGILAIIGVIGWIIAWNTRTILNVVLSAISPIKPEFYGSTSPAVKKLLPQYWKVGKKPMS